MIRYIIKYAPNVTSDANPPCGYFTSRQEAELKLEERKCSRPNNGYYLVTEFTGGKFMNSLKAYVEKHKDMFFKIAFVAILDHFLFDGAFRDKLKNLVDRFLEGQHGPDTKA
jgi:hypothetical protein